MDKNLKEQTELAGFRLMSYGFLQSAFSYPDDKIYRNISGSPLKFLKEKDERFEFFGYIPPKDDMEVVYTSYFDSIYKKDGCSLREGEYLEEKSGISNLLLELKGFYKNFGLNLPLQELPDFIGVEFEFMQYLSYLYLKCIEGGYIEKIPSVLNAQNDFLNRHLHAFVINVKDKLSGFPGLKFYSQVAGFAQDFIETDMQILEDEKAAFLEKTLPVN